MCIVLILLEVYDRKTRSSGLKPTHWTFKNPLWVGTGTEMRTQCDDIATAPFGGGGGGE